MPLLVWPELPLFMALILVVCIFVVVAAEHFPTEFRAPDLATTGGTVLLWSTIVLIAVSSAIAVYVVFVAIPWYSAVIGSGLMALVAPLLVQPLPDALINGRSALLLLAAMALGLDCAVLAITT